MVIFISDAYSYTAVVRIHLRVIGEAGTARSLFTHSKTLNLLAVFSLRSKVTV